MMFALITWARALRSAHLLSLLMILFLPSLQGCATKSDRSMSSLYDSVKQRGTIRCGYGIYNPGCMKDPNTGKLTGIGVEALEAIAKEQGLKLDWVEEVGWGSMIEGLLTNRYDIIATPIWKSDDRARRAEFSKPLYFSPVYAYIKAGNKRLAGADLSVLNSSEYSMASIDGATAEIVAQKDYPKIRRVSLPQLSDFSQLLLTVSTGKADVTFTEPADAAVFMKQNPGAVEKLGKPVRVFANCWMFRKDQPKFKRVIDDGIDHLVASGTMDKLISKYEPEPNALVRVSALQGGTE